jgi:hypothetical protein
LIRGFPFHFSQFLTYFISTHLSYLFRITFQLNSSHRIITSQTSIKMYAQVILYTLAAASVVNAHGKVAVVTGNLGGNGTALGIKGAVVPGPGPNYETEVDTTVFWSKDIATDDDIGYIEDGSGNNQLSDLAQAMALSGSTLPQVCILFLTLLLSSKYRASIVSLNMMLTQTFQVSSGGSVNGTFHIVTSDGAGPLQALVDESATGKWSTAKSASVTTQVPGTDGNVEGSTKRSIWTRTLIKMGLITARATNVNEDHVSDTLMSLQLP